MRIFIPDHPEIVSAMMDLGLIEADRLGTYTVTNQQRAPEALSQLFNLKVTNADRSFWHIDVELDNDSEYATLFVLRWL